MIFYYSITSVFFNQKVVNYNLKVAPGSFPSFQSIFYYRPSYRASMRDELTNNRAQGTEQSKELEQKIIKTTKRAQETKKTRNKGQGAAAQLSLLF